jgi:hypothetical protein
MATRIKTKEEVLKMYGGDKKRMNAEMRVGAKLSAAPKGKRITKSVLAKLKPEMVKINSKKATRKSIGSRIPGSVMRRTGGVSKGRSK